MSEANFTWFLHAHAIGNGSNKITVVHSAFSFYKKFVYKNVEGEIFSKMQENNVWAELRYTLFFIRTSNFRLRLGCS